MSECIAGNIMVIEQDNELKISGLEWSGRLAGSAGQGALFSLYLAMVNEADVAPSIDSESDLAVVDAHFPARLNHYRRSPLKADDADFFHLQHTAQLMAHGDSHTARLLQSMHPEPLSLKNDAKAIPADVIANCSLKARKRLLDQLQKPVPEQQTLLDDIIRDSAAFLAA